MTFFLPYISILVGAFFFFLFKDHHYLSKLKGNLLLLPSTHKERHSLYLSSTYRLRLICFGKKDPKDYQARLLR